MNVASYPGELEAVGMSVCCVEAGAGGVCAGGRRGCCELERVGGGCCCCWGGERTTRFRIGFVDAWRTVRVYCWGHCSFVVVGCVMVRGRKWRLRVVLFNDEIVAEKGNAQYKYTGNVPEK